VTVTAVPAPKPPTYATLCATPVAGALGAEISGVDLSRSLTEGQLNELRRAVVEHRVVFLRDQPHSFDAQRELTERLGGFGETPFVGQVDGQPGIVAVVREADEQGIANFGGGWHSDWSFQAAPPSFTLLWAVDVPPYGGDTLWANLELAYERCSSGLRATLDGLRAVHSARRSYAPGSHIDQTRSQRAMRIDTSASALDEQVHPLVTVHPESGRRALFLNPTYVLRIDGWTAEESQPLLAHLHAHATREAFTCRFRWSAGTLAIWDNRATEHNAINDYDGFRREAYRSTVAGTVPQGVSS